jgi:hypothetical protein
VRTADLAPLEGCSVRLFDKPGSVRRRPPVHPLPGSRFQLARSPFAGSPSLTWLQGMDWPAPCSTSRGLVHPSPGCSVRLFESRPRVGSLAGLLASSSPCSARESLVPCWSTSQLGLLHSPLFRAPLAVFFSPVAGDSDARVLGAAPARLLRRLILPPHSSACIELPRREC